MKKNDFISGLWLKGLKTSLWAILTLFSMNSSAQVYEYAFTAGGTFYDDVYAMTQDGAYNYYITGDFVGTADFDPSANTANLVCPNAPCGYIAKYDSAGNYMWAKMLQATNAPAEPRAMQLDNNGNICLSGWFMDSVDFDPGPGVSKLGAQGAHDAFIAKYDTAGNYLWAKSFGGVAPDLIYGMDIDASNNIIVTGYFIFQADFDPSPATQMLSANSASPDIFIAKYDPSGNYLWAVNIGGPMQDEGNDVKVDAGGNIFVTGYFNGAADFDPTANTQLIASQGLTDAFITKYDAMGNMVWSHGIGGSGNEEGQSLALNSASDIFLTGSFETTADFDPSMNVTNRTSAGGQDMFLAKYDSAAVLGWVKTMGGSVNEVPNKILLDNNYLYITGDFNSANADFDPSAGIVTLASAGAEDVFMARYDITGNYMMAERVGGGSPDHSYAMMIEDNSNIYIGGNFEGTADFDPSAATANFTAVASRDLFVAKYNFCKELLTTEADTICKGESYTWNGMTLNTAGSYIVFLASSQGCDSTVTLDLAIDSVENYTVSKSFATLTVNGITATYQWIDCNNNNNPVAGANSSSFTASVNGSYAVVVAQGMCVDTSACFNIDSIGVGISKNVLQKTIEVYPNPSAGIFTFKVQKPVSVKIYNSIGKIVFSGDLRAGQQEVDLGKLPEGLYYLQYAQSKEPLKLVISH